MNGLNGIDSGLSLQLLHNNEQVALKKYKYILVLMNKENERQENWEKIKHT